MTTRTRLYDPEGIPFDVPTHKIGDLVLNQGWSQTPLDKSAPAAAAPAPAEDHDEEGLDDEPFLEDEEEDAPAPEEDEDDEQGPN